MVKKIKLKVECSSCGATGLYKGMAEGGACAVICISCEGTGAIEKEFKIFSERKERKDIKRVFQNSCGYGHSDQDFTDKNNRTIKFSEAGCTYQEFLKGKKPKPVKDLYCPYLWTSQRLQTKDKNDLYKTRCNTGLRLGNYISDCKHFSDKSKCWEIFEKKKKKEKKL